MSERESEASSRFKCTTAERGTFEAGIKLATVYHQFVGSPFNIDTVDMLERTIEKTIAVQPYVSYVRIKIDRSLLVSGGDRYSYLSLTGDMIDATVKIDIDGTVVTAEMRYDEELKYPLMFISSIDS